MFEFNSKRFFRLELSREEIDGRRHYVTPAGKKYPSITTLLQDHDLEKKKQIERWVNKIGEQEAKRIQIAAFKRGNILHEAAENYLMNKEIDTTKMFEESPIAVNLWIALRYALVEYIEKVYLLESTLYTDVLQIAGTLDCLADTKGGHLTVVDFKTAKRSKKKEWITDYFLQCTAYALMIAERYSIGPSKIMVIIVNEESNQPQVFEEDPKNWVKHRFFLDRFKKIAGCLNGC